MPKYRDLLRHPRWQKKRLEVMSRDNFSCLFCLDAESPLNVHHEFYERGRKPWEYPDDSLFTLCEACHELIHNTSCSKAELKSLAIDRYCFGTMTAAGVEYLFRINQLAEE